MTPSSSTTPDQDQGTEAETPDQDQGTEAETPVLDAEIEEDLDSSEDDEDLAADEEAPADDTAGSDLPSRRRRALSAVIGTVVFEVLYLVAITVIAFATAGTAAVGPTLQSVVTGPFVWVPATVFLVCALVVGLPLQGARRAPVLTGLLLGVVVYLASTLLVLLVAAGPSALGVYVPELSVYPFFLTGIIAREIMAWTRWGRPRRRATGAGVQR